LADQRVVQRVVQMAAELVVPWDLLSAGSMVDQLAALRAGSRAYQRADAKAGK
jgi:hypothetical protein